MSAEQPVPIPLFDWYQVWPSHRKEEEDGTIWSQEPPHGIELSIEPAQKSEIFFHPEHPWEQDARIDICTMMHEGGRYRLWYGTTKSDDRSENYICYAESDDGYHWSRPELGLVEYEGSSKNNIISADREHHLGAVFMDPAGPPEARYKAINPGGRYYRDGKLDTNMTSEQFKELLIALDLGGVSPEERRKKVEVRQTVHASVSPDGIHWTNLDEPILDVGNTMLDTHNLCTYDPYQQKYVAYLRGHVNGRRRVVRRAESRDFAQLEEPRFCLIPDPQDPADDDIYNPCYSPYPNQPLYLMFPSLYHRIASTLDIQLAVSRDSYNWQRPERRPIIDRSYDGGEYGALYAYPNLLDLDNGEWRLAYTGHHRKHDFLDRGRNYPVDFEHRWASWKKDRLVGLEAPDEGFVVLMTKPCAGAQLHLNYRTAPDGWIKVELVKLPETPPKPVDAFEGFGLEEAETLSGDELSRVVSWNGKSDLADLKGKDVYLRLHMYKAKVFSFSI